MVDDWMMLVQYHFDQSIWKSVHHWNTIGGGGIRPIGSIFFGLTPALFGIHPVPYILLNTACWIGSILLISRVVKEYCGEVSARWFILLGSVPTIASSTIFEPIVMIIGSASTLFWSLALVSLARYMRTSEQKYYWGMFILALIGMLIYEVSAPLMLIMMFLPIIPHLKGRPFPLSEPVRQALRRFTLPVVLLIVALMLFQKFIVPMYGVNLSRLSARPLGDMLRSFARWAYSVIVDSPVMIGSSVTHYGYALLLRWDWWLLVISTIIFVITLQKTSSHEPSSQKSSRERKLFLLLVTLTLLSCSALSVFSGFNMRIEGIENRFLGSTWILVCILLSALFHKLSNGWKIIIPALFLILTYHSFMVQADNYVKNRQLQQAVIDDCFERIKNAPIGKQAFIVGNVPIYANNNFNNEIVFAYRHDFGGHLKILLNSKEIIDEGQTINVNKEAPTNDTTRFFLSRDRDTVMTGNLTGVMKRSINGNVWWYEYDQFTRKAALMRVRDTLHFDSILTSSRKGLVNASPLPVTERFRNSIKSILTKK